MNFNQDWEKESIGSDESGKGDFFGGPSIVAVYVNEEIIKRLKSKPFYQGIKDSKQCEDSWIKKHVHEIKEICQCAEITITAKEYNELYEKFQNANIIFSYLHDKIHKKLEKNTHRIMDAFVNEQNHNKYMNQIGVKGIKIHEFATKADSKYLSVALASIIARYNYVMQMEKISEETNVNIPFGNSYSEKNSVIYAYEKLLENGFEESYIDNNLVKKNFNTLNKIKEIIKQ